MIEKSTEYMQELIAVGVDKKQAKVMADYMERLSIPAKSEFITKLEFKSELKELENTLIKWMIGTAIGILIIVFTVIEFRITGIERSIDQNREAINQNREAINQNREAISQVQTSIQKLIELQLEQAKNN